MHPLCKLLPDALMPILPANLSQKLRMDTMVINVS